MKCPQCQHENRSDAKFCEECATPFAQACSKCGSVLSPTAKFCPECAEPTSAPPAQARFGSPGSYTPKHLAERILTSKTALEGERKQVTVLFADLKSSMELLADRDPEEARKVLDPVLEYMMEAVHRYEGTVNQVMGDGIMALFGAPLAHEDHAVRACYAALRMQESVKRYADAVRRSQGVEIQIRVGMNSGDVVVRSVGSDLRMDYTAVGQTTHLAARMEQITAPETIALTRATLALAEGFVDVKSLGLTPVKGLAEPVEVYELRGASAVRSRLQAVAVRGLTKFVGRSVEMTHLHDTLDLARNAKGQVVAVVGEPGVGKSRLFWEFAHSHSTEGCLVLEAASVSYGKATAYYPVIALLRSYFAVDARDDARRVREKVVGKLLSLDRALEPSLPALLSLLDVSVDDDTWSRLDPPQRRQRTLDGVKRLLLRESQVQPLIVVFEDLHWIDGETQALLDRLTEILPTARLLMLVNYRPEYQHGWSSKTYYRQLRIDPLPAVRADELLDALLGTDATLAPLKRLLIERTEGNPFFMEESTRRLIETGVLVGSRGDYRLTRAPEALQIPATAQAILAARLDRLDPDDKRLLQAAAVIGKDFAVALLAEIAEASAEALHRGLGRLQASEFVYETKVFPEVEYTFKHALTHEVAYGSLLHSRRRILHAAIMEAIETLYADRLAEQLERLAHHAVGAEQWDKALGYLRQAGVRAVTRSAHREAVAYFEQALAVLRRLPETHRTLEQEVDVRIDLRNCLFPLGEHAAILEHIQEAERIAATLDDPRRLGWASALMAHYFWRTGEHERAVEAGRRALRLSLSVADVALKVSAQYYLGLAFLALGRYESAMQILEKNLELLQGDQLQERFGMTGLPSVFCRTWWAWCAAETGQFGPGTARATEGLRIAESVDHPYSLVFACRGLSHIHLGQGNLDKAILFLERGLRLCQTWGFPPLLAGLAPSLGAAYAQSGRVEEGIVLLEQAVGFATARNLRFSLALWLAHLAQAYLFAGRTKDGHGTAIRALELARACGERGNEASVLHLLAEIVAAGTSANSGSSETLYKEALALADELGMRPLAARCHLGLGTVLRTRGQSGQAQEQLRRAAEMFRALEMSTYLAKAETELFHS